MSATAEDRIARGLRSIRWRRRLFWIAVTSILPIVLIGVFVRSPFVFVAMVAAWGTTVLLALRRVMVSRCPGCQEKFHEEPLSETFLRDGDPLIPGCASCQLPLRARGPSRRRE